MGPTRKRARFIRSILNILVEALHQKKGLAWDVRNRGHCGNRPTEIVLTEDSDFADVMGLVRQAHDYQLSDEQCALMYDIHRSKAVNPATAALFDQTFDRDPD